MSSESTNQVNGLAQSHAPSVPNSSQIVASKPSFTHKWVDNHCVDVFEGNGWDNWTRFVKHGKQLRMIAGKPVSPELYNQLRKEL